MDKKIIDRAKEIEKRLDMLASDINSLEVALYSARRPGVEIANATAAWAAVYRVTKLFRKLIEDWESFPQSESAG